MNPFVTPLMRAAPRRMMKEEADAFARRTGWVDDIAVIDPDTSVVEVLALPWWDGVELVVARDPGWPRDNALAAWMLDDQLTRLDGTSPPIHKLNARRPPRLDAATVLPYLGFFCFFVRGEEGPFTILESADDPLMSAPAAYELGDRIRPAALLAEKEDGFHCEATVWYADTFFLSNFVVRKNGMIEMIEDEPILQETGLRIDMPLVFKQPASGADG